MLETSAASDTPARAHALVVTQTSPHESKAQRRVQTFVRACHMLLSAAEETLFLILAHVQYYNSLRAPARISDELAASVTRQIQKIDKLLESRANGEAGSEEKSLLDSKRSFLAFCAQNLQ
jgi:hypothetical protein